MGIQTNVLPKMSVYSDSDELLGNFSNTTGRTDVDTFADYVAEKVNASISKVNDYYGIIIHQSTANSSSRVEYTGLNKDFTPMTMNLSTGENNFGSWASMPTIAQNRPAMIRSNGTFDYWLNPNDYNFKLDGTTASDVANVNYDGNAFSRFIPIWMCVRDVGDDLEVRFAYEQLEYDYYPVCPEGREFWIPMFYGATVNGKMRSIANTNPVDGSKISTAVQKQRIEANGSGDDYNYMFAGGKFMQAIKFLLTMWYKSTNSDVWGYGNRSGYDSTDTTTYGTKQNPVVGGGQFYGTSDGKSANKVLHSVALASYDVFLRDPYLINNKGEYQVSKDYSYSESGAGYTKTGLGILNSGWQKTLRAVPGFGAVPVDVGGSNSTFYADYVWVNNNQIDCALNLGSCNAGADDGAFGLHVNLAFGRSDWGTGCAVLLNKKREELN